MVKERSGLPPIGTVAAVHAVTLHALGISLTCAAYLVKLLFVWSFRAIFYRMIRPYSMTRPRRRKSLP
jgi:hypothetical protein